jgi:uncharacterized membrane protein YeaQ/YmgE (transglycosylase-associated protein family)
MSLIWTIVIGLFVGLLARALVPGKDEAGVVITTALGISGALIGTAIARLTGLYNPNLATTAALSVFGATILLIAYKKIFVPLTQS